MIQVRIFSGLGSSIVPYFSRGTRKIYKQINSSFHQIQVSHHIWSSWRGICDGLICQFKQDKSHEPIILIGHSNGVLACCNIAHRLAEMDIHVAYIAAIDPTPFSFPYIGDNVAKVDEFWGSSGVSQMARRLSHHRVAYCKFTNGWVGSHRLYVHKASHVGVSYHKDVLKKIYASVYQIVDAESAEQNHHQGMQPSSK